MRRISIIAGKVFGGHGHRLAFVPSRYEQYGGQWFLNKRDLKFVFSEYSKIAWFMLYGHFTWSSTNRFGRPDGGIAAFLRTYP